MTQTEPTHTFQVDLRGMVDLLSHHLYSSPRVYIRELLQNAVDAITARRLLDPGAPAAITIRASGGGSLTVTDSGIGLTEDEVHRFLATIGRSSKRDEDGLALERADFIGQFGIGLLACFVVADEITVVTRSAREPGAPAVEWRGRSDGRYSIRLLPAGSRPDPGTTVTLVPRPGSEEWLASGRVGSLARHFGSLLRYEVTLDDGDGAPIRITDTPPAWDRPHPSPAQRREALAEYGRRTFDFDQLDVIDLDLPLVGLRGVAFVLPTTVHPTRKAGHRVHLRGMLVSDQATELLPDWAFFVRCVVDTEALRPTASREALYEDETLAAVRDALGARIRDWLTGLAAQEPQRLAAFLSVHALGVKALARHDHELLRIMLPYLQFESTDGVVTLAEFARRHPRLHVSPTVEEFRQVAPIASAQGIGVINGGYTYDTELLSVLPDLIPGVTVQELDATVVTAALDPADAAAELALAGLLAAARAALDPLDCDVILRAFHPVAVSALHLDSRAARNERARAEVMAEADDLWAEILGALKSSAPRAQLVLNHNSPVVRALARVTDPALLATAVESLYGQALLMTHRPLRPADAALLNRAFGELLSRAMHAAPDEEDRG